MYDIWKTRSDRDVYPDPDDVCCEDCDHGLDCSRDQPIINPLPERLVPADFGVGPVDLSESVPF